jgi:hypothetical protein
VTKARKTRTTGLVKCNKKLTPKYDRRTVFKEISCETCVEMER